MTLFNSNYFLVDVFFFFLSLFFLSSLSITSNCCHVIYSSTSTSIIFHFTYVSHTLNLTSYIPAPPLSLTAIATTLFRYRLEHYELSCAADTVTGRCAGHHRECTKAMLGLLGTDLHTNCVCKGVAFQDINQCLAWKRLIWGNPCVGQSTHIRFAVRVFRDTKMFLIIYP